MNGRPAELNLKLYTHLCHAFVVADGDGRLRKSSAVPDSGFVAQAHRHRVRVLVSLGGWGWDAQFAQIVSNPAAETRFVKAVCTLVETNDYDGIDLDWEYPDSEDEAPGFERLARRLRAGLDAIAARKQRPMELTMAASASPGKLAWLSTDLLTRTMDWVNVMTYDYAGGWSSVAGHNAPFKTSSRAPEGADQSVTGTFDYLLKERRLPPEHFALGLPLYGRAFSVGEPYASIIGTEDAGRAVLFRQTLGLPGKGWQRIVDAETQAPWLLSANGDQLLGYDDAESVRRKTEWAKEQGLRGVFFWEVSQDRVNGANPLQQAAKAAWLADPR